MNIKNKRIAAGLTQEELGEKIGYGQSAVANWENGNRSPRPTDLPRLAKILGCTIDELFEEE